MGSAGSATHLARLR